MAEIVLSQAGAVAGASLLPNGLTVFGQAVSGAAIGAAAGRLAGRAIDASMMPVSEGPRVKSLKVLESREGAGLPTVYGRMRVGGQVIWASRFKEKRRERSAGKGGPKYSEYSYSVSFAVALCQGSITRVDRIWANGELIALGGVNWRLYKGDEDQMPDPLIEAIEGADFAPAYKGVAYIVFEDMPLDPYGNRMPQLSFEVVRAGEVRADSLREIVKGVNIIPASGEFVYATQIVRERRFPGIERALNMNNGEGRADFDLSVDQLRADLPKADHSALTVAWFGDDLRAGDCRLRPGVETRERETVPYGWTVDGTGRGSAHLISGDAGHVNFGGTPADRAVLEGIEALKVAGVSVTLSPFLLMDIPGGNGLSDPYGGAEQSAFPWRGRIKVNADGTQSARAEIEAFVGEDGQFGFRHFILHHARLAAEAGGVDTLLIGSEMVGLTRVRDDQGRFPFVDALVDIAREAKAIVGPSVSVSYAADWTEYGAQQLGSDLEFPLDALWSSDDVDFIGLDWYPPAGDWRDGDDHLDALAGYKTEDDPEYLLANMAGGEAYDWYYASEADRQSQTRTVITDTAYGEDWVFRAKDLSSWWNNTHFPRTGGVRDEASTTWQPQSKPVRLIEIGFPAVDRGGNAPNLFYDPKSSESAFPPFSKGSRDDLFQRRALASALTYWEGQSFIEQALVWAWDGRPWPHYPAREDVWTDGPNWQFGHWLNGRSGLIELSEVIEDLARRAGITVDVSEIEGFLEGFGLEGIADLRTALAPLKSAYGIICNERQGELVFSHANSRRLVPLGKAQLIEGSCLQNRTLLDKQPGALELTYISGDHTYEPAVVRARNDKGDRDYSVRLTLPMVMAEARAQSVAKSLLEDILAVASARFAIGPISLIAEPGDLVKTSEDGVLQITKVSDKSLMRIIELAPVQASGEAVRAIEPVSVDDVALVPAQPELVLVDSRFNAGRNDVGVLVGVTANPWPGRVSINVGGRVEALIGRASFDAPCGVGSLMSSLQPGPIGRWDEGAHATIWMPDEELSSASGSSVLSGTNRILIENSDGWELLAWREAVLIDEDTWRLKGLLRGLSGTTPAGASVGARALLVDDRLQFAEIEKDEIGLELFWQAGVSDPVLFSHEDKHCLPWRVGHLKAEKRDSTWTVSWIRRSREIADSWSLPESENAGLFKVEALLGGDLIGDWTVTQSNVVIPAVSMDRIHVAEVGLDNRVGEWASIPLFAA